MLKDRIADKSDLILREASFWQGRSLESPQGMEQQLCPLFPFKSCRSSPVHGIFHLFGFVFPGMRLPKAPLRSSRCPLAFLLPSSPGDLLFPFCWLSWFLVLGMHTCFVASFPVLSVACSFCTGVSPDQCNLPGDQSECVVNGALDSALRVQPCW